MVVVGERNSGIQIQLRDQIPIGKIAWLFALLASVLVPCLFHYTSIVTRKR